MAVLVDVKVKTCGNVSGYKTTTAAAAAAVLGKEVVENPRLSLCEFQLSSFYDSFVENLSAESLLRDGVS